MKALVLALLLVALAAPENLLAQEGRIATSTDVRLTLTSVRDLRGTLMGWEADSLRIQDPASGFVSVVPSLDVIRLRIPEPRTRGRGALRGLLIGSIAGALALGIAAVATPCEGWLCYSAGEVFLLGAAVGGITGGGIGAAAGAAWPGTRWVDVAPPRSER